jgi:AAA domain
VPLGDQPAPAWSLRNGGLPDWATGVGAATLIIIDEAGMADTLSLDTTVEFAIDHGASVRLIGDDQQFAAIGAGGVLSDIKQTHGAMQLTELHRFTNRPVLPSSSGVQMSPHMQRRQPTPASGERCSPGRAPGRRVRQRPPAVRKWSADQ